MANLIIQSSNTLLIEIGGIIITQSHLWIANITTVLKELGGHGTLNDLYQKSEEREEMGLTTAKKYKNTI